MYSVMASGKDFEVLNSTYDLSWNDAKPIFAEYVSMLLQIFLIHNFLLI